MSKLFAFILIAFAAAVPAAQPRVHSIPVFQSLETPFGEDYPPYITQDVAIDGDSIIALIDKSHEEEPVTRVALLYRRGTDGRWALTQTLGQVTAPRADLRAELAMRNNIAVFKIHRDGASIWEKIGGSWIQATVAGGLNEPGGFAISQSRILAGASGCDNDGVIYEKSGSGVWLITGRIAPDAGVARISRAPSSSTTTLRISAIRRRWCSRTGRTARARMACRPHDQHSKPGLAI